MGFPWFPDNRQMKPAMQLQLIGATALLLAPVAPASASGRLTLRRDPGSFEDCLEPALSASSTSPGTFVAGGASRLDVLGSALTHTCSSITPLDWKACGSPSISKCQCIALGCCWGKGSPFASELVKASWRNIPSCYYLHGGGHSFTPAEWSIQMKAPAKLELAMNMKSFKKGEAEGVRFSVIRATRTCGQPGATQDTAVAKCTPKITSKGFTIEVLVNEEGMFKVCMNDSKMVRGR